MINISQSQFFFTKKRALIFLSLGMLFAFVAGWFIWQSPSHKHASLQLPQQVSSPSPSPSASPNSGSLLGNLNSSHELLATPVNTQNTGVIESSSSGQKQEQELAQRSLLKSKLPINTQQFSLSYDYNKLQMIVSIRQPYATNKKFFTNWLQKNYPTIPLKIFSIQQLDPG